MTQQAYARLDSASSAKMRFYRGKVGDFVISLREVAAVDHIGNSSANIGGGSNGGVNYRSTSPGVVGGVS